MKLELEPSLDRWVEAQILDRQQADLIRQFESEQIPYRASQWQVILAVAFGGIMLAAGILLFVSAHWDELSPLQRMALLVSAVGGLHLAGSVVRGRFYALSVTLHAVGTVALGGAIAMAGQVFNMQEHWPTAVLLWAIGAIAGWLLLRDWPHALLAAILVPWWLCGEWWERAGPVSNPAPVTGGILLAAICYLSGGIPGAGAPERHVRAALTWLGGIALLPAAVAAAQVGNIRTGARIDFGMLAAGWAVAILFSLAFSYAFCRNAAWMNVVAALWVVGLRVVAEARLDVLLYGWYALGSAAMIAWGIYEARAERINLGMAGFALTIIFFFFSNVMDKLARSASLMTLGALLIAGGWYWEKLRRRLVAQIESGDAL